MTARAVLGSEVNDGDLLEVLGGAYAHESFVSVTDRWPDTKAVAGSNRAVVHARVDREAGVVVASCAIDNLGKGAAGQAIQNANLALGIDETCGLSIAGVWP
ncbi:MAG: N-acetyl-gamma-glutamyl-phosphate reductase [Actinomycetota bacterium]|nr:N-acetyl-gamma-glutamyl-phosphate reductase [Actinomycetota bacterium]